jgi:hypothetical protein
MRDVLNRAYAGFHDKYLLLLSDFNQNRKVSTNFSTKSQTLNVHSIGIMIFHGDRQAKGRMGADMTRLTVTFRNCPAHAPNEWHIEMNPTANGVMKLPIQ